MFFLDFDFEFSLSSNEWNTILSPTSHELSDLEQIQ